MAALEVDVSVLPKGLSQKAGPAEPAAPSPTWHRGQAINICGLGFVSSPTLSS